MNRYKLKANERLWFSDNTFSLRGAVSRCKSIDPGSFCYEQDILRINSKILLYDGISVYRVKTFRSKLLRVMYE